MKNIKEFVKTIPSNPGVYQFFDKSGNRIYVGKAKNLKKRVSSYFNHKADNHKVRVMVEKIAKIEYVVVDSESDAFLLENNLIKEFQPRYNILLKDDKSFPWICIKNESFPRVFHTRNPVKDGSQYFGPYTSMVMVRTIMSLIRQLYKIRTCNYNLSIENIRKAKYKTCLEYHLGNCLGPCAGLQDEENYNHAIFQIRDILKGNLSVVLSVMKREMQELALNLKFEEANQIKEKIKILEKYKSKSTIVNPLIQNVDVFSFLEDEDDVYVNYMRVVEGAVVQSHTIELKRKMDESIRDILSFVVFEMRQRFRSNSNEIILPVDIKLFNDKVKITVPVRGDKKKLLDLSDQNLKYYKLEKLKQIESINKINKTEQLLESVKTDLRLPSLPVLMDCFDNSNLMGTHAVSACVVFKNGKPLKSEYRHYNVKTVTGVDDYATMREVVYRRYKRIIAEGKPLPQLIIIDGGKGQLNAAYEILRQLKIDDKISLIGIAKRLEEIYFVHDPVPLYLNKNSYTLKLIQQIRDEAHRFGILFHRQKRSKKMIDSELLSIKGIGQFTMEKLYRKYKNIQIIKNLDIAELEKEIGKSKARIVWKHYHTLNI